ncbi:MFS transporter [Streptomyces sp. NPDC127051]|uniref:MFS transporter n=1 Tax=Streptomyces sp. NPDC127051 TaxID=3347119 RepID=UPI00365F7776
MTACLGLFISALNTTMTAVALPQIQQALMASPTQLQWIIDVYLLVVGCLLLTTGRLGDRYGHGRVYMLGLAIFIAGAFAGSVTDSAVQLIAARGVQAVGASVLSTATLSLIAQAFDKRTERARAIGIWTAAMGLGQIVGPTAGGLLADTFGWRSIFIASALVALLALLLCWTVLPKMKATRAEVSLDIKGQVLTTVVLTAFLYSLIEGQEWPWSDLVLWLAPVAAAVGAAFLLRHSGTTSNALIDVQLFRRRRFSSPLLLAGLMFFAFNGFQYYNSIYLQRVLGESASAAGLWMLPSAVAIAASAPAAGNWCAARGARLPATTGALLMVGGLMILAFAPERPPALTLAISYIAIGTGLGMANGPLSMTVMSAAPEERSGSASSILATSRLIGGALSVAIVGGTVNIYLKGTSETDSGWSQELTAGLHLGYIVVSGTLLCVVLLTRRSIPAERADDRKT